MKKNIYSLLKLLFFFIIFAGLFYILELGFAIGSWDKFITPLLLSGMTVMMLVKKHLRHLVFTFSIICLAVMILIYLFNLLDFAKIVGNFGFSALMITVTLYIPQIIKDGYIEKF